MSKFKKIEPIFFFIICIINMYPVLQGAFFGNMDGAPHIYNANVIKHLLFSNNELLSSYYAFNPELIPNLSGHYIMAFLSLFMPSLYAEKILLIIYLMGLPLTFRALIKSINSSNILLSYLILPFTYSYMFHLGFYNFSLAIVFMFLALNYWFCHKNKKFTLKQTVVFISLILLTYFSHLFVFVIFVFIVGLHIIYCFFDETNSKKPLSFYLKNTLTKIILFIGYISLPLALAIYYVLSRDNDSNYFFLEKRELFDSLKILRPIIGYNASVEDAYTKKILYVFLILTLIIFYNWINKLIDDYHRLKSIKQTIRNTISTKSFFWGIIVLCLLLLYFIIPDKDGSGAYFTVRIGLFVFLFMIVWFSAHTIRKWLVAMAVISVLFLSYKLNVFYTKTIKDLNKTAESCYEAAEHISDNSVVLPLNYTNHWMMGHFFYIGLDKPIVLLENYECSQGYFPLIWNLDKIPNSSLGKDIYPSKIHCLYWPNNFLNKKKIIDYVFIVGSLENLNDPCKLDAKDTILNNYKLTFKNEHCELYAYKFKDV